MDNAKRKRTVKKLYTALHPCEARDLPEPYAVPCREIGVRFSRDAAGYGHWTCPDHEGLVRAVADNRSAAWREERYAQPGDAADAPTGDRWEDR